MKKTNDGISKINIFYFYLQIESLPEVTALYPSTPTLSVYISILIEEKQVQISKCINS